MTARTPVPTAYGAGPPGANQIAVGDCVAEEHGDPLPGPAGDPPGAADGRRRHATRRSSPGGCRKAPERRRSARACRPHRGATASAAPVCRACRSARGTGSSRSTVPRIGVPLEALRLAGTRASADLGRVSATEAATASDGTSSTCGVRVGQLSRATSCSGVLPRILRSTSRRTPGARSIASRSTSFRSRARRVRFGHRRVEQDQALDALSGTGASAAWPSRRPGSVRPAPPDCRATSRTNWPIWSTSASSGVRPVERRVAGRRPSRARGGRRPALRRRVRQPRAEETEVQRRSPRARGRTTTGCAPGGPPKSR